MSDTTPSSPGHAEPMTPLQALAARVRANADASSGLRSSSPTIQGSGALSRPGSPSLHGDARGQQRSRSQYEDDDDEEDPVSSGLTAHNTTNLALLAPILKRARRLGIQAEADLDIYLAAPPAERSAYQYALSLANTEALTTLALHLKYELPPTLRTTCNHYAWAYMLSPTITSYRTAEGAEAVLAVMRDLNVSDLPPKHETGRCEEVIRVIGKTMITCRHHMKDKIMETLDPKKAIARDIGSLSAAILSRSKVKLTAAFYIRVAVIRWVAESFPEYRKDENFWVKVDECMAETRNEFRTAVLILRPGVTDEDHDSAFMELYEDDKRKYGVPDLMMGQPMEFRNQDDWIQQLSDRASRPALQSAGTLALASKQSTRRRAPPK